jgi:hypothetical protein
MPTLTGNEIAKLDPIDVPSVPGNGNARQRGRGTTV